MNRRKTEATDDLVLEDVLAQIPDEGGWTVRISRVVAPVNGGKEKTRFLGEWEPSQVSETALAGQWGAGKYLCRPYCGGKGEGVSKTVEIDPDATAIQNAEPYLAPTADHTAENTRMDALTQMQLEHMRQTADLARESSADMMKMILAMIAADGGRPGADLAGIAGLITAVRPADGGGGGLSAVREVIGVAKELMPENKNGGEAGPWDVLGQLVPMAVKAAGNLPALPPAAIASQAPTADPAQNPPRIATAEEQGTPDMQELMKARLDFLKKLNARAAAGQPTEMWADYIEDNAAFEEPCQWLLSVAGAPDFKWPEVWATCRQALPEVEPHEVWFRDLYAELVEIVEVNGNPSVNLPAGELTEGASDDSGKSDTPGTGGNPPDSDSDGGPGQGTADPDLDPAGTD
jgi:hypothetical protein